MHNSLVCGSLDFWKFALEVELEQGVHSRMDVALFQEANQNHSAWRATLYSISFSLMQPMNARGYTLFVARKGTNFNLDYVNKTTHTIPASLSLPHDDPGMLA